jgi:hypothetical protein
MDRSTYICGGETALSFRMPSVLTITAQVIERNPYAQKYKKLWKVYQTTGSEELQLKFVRIALDDQRRYNNYSLNLFSVHFPNFFFPKSLK